MILQWTTMGNIIARIDRNMGGNLPGAFIGMIPEWIDEAMLQLQTKWELEKTSTPCKDCPEPVVTKQHVANLPCGMSVLLAVEDEYGRRMRYGTDQLDFTRQSARVYPNSGANTIRATNFQMDVSKSAGWSPSTENATEGAIPWDGSDIQPFNDSGRGFYYQIQGNKIQTSEESMFIRIHYLKVPTDEKGLPLIPENENYKQALFYYVMKQLIAAGVKHPIWSGQNGYTFLDDQFEKFAGRAIAEITYPSVDRMESIRVAWAERIIFPYSMWEDFGIGYEQYRGINYI